MFRPHRATAEEMSQYHNPEYIDFIRSKVNTRSKYFLDLCESYNLGEQGDCPMFPGVYEFCQISCGGSIDGAIRLNHQLNDTCINWAGGLHHARKQEAAGFCYTNDIVLAILELLKFHKRVLYIDIDIHHGDGVEEAFYFSDRVFTCSFHRYGEDFFPGTGPITDFGEREGRFCTANFPLKDGITDDDFLDIFCPIIDKIMERYDPSAIVLQCGADSLLGDRLGFFNLSIKAHAACVAHVRNYRVPLLVLGGGGYTIPNVSRCWAYETAVVCKVQENIINNFTPGEPGVGTRSGKLSNKELKERSLGKYTGKLNMHDISYMKLFNDVIPEEIPREDTFYDFYRPTYTLDLRYKVQPPNGNSEDILRKYKRQILQNIDRLKGPPSVQFQQLQTTELETKVLKRMEEEKEAQEDRELDVIEPAQVAQPT